MYIYTLDYRRIDIKISFSGVCDTSVFPPQDNKKGPINALIIISFFS